MEGDKAYRKINLGKGHWKYRGVGLVVLNRMIRAGLTEMTFEQRLEGGEGRGHATTPLTQN